MKKTEASYVRVEHTNAVRVADKYVWEYRRGPEVIRAFARFHNGNHAPRRPFSGWLNEAFSPVEDPRFVPFAVVQGVPFIATEGRSGPLRKPGVVIEAYLNDQITLAFATTATKETTLAFLNQIDFDALNKMLDVPVPGIGRHAPDITEEEANTLANLHANARNEDQPLMLSDMNVLALRGVTDFQPYVRAQGLEKAVPLSEEGKKERPKGLWDAINKYIVSQSMPSEERNRFQLSRGGFCSGDLTQACKRTPKVRPDVKIAVPER